MSESYEIDPWMPTIVPEVTTSSMQVSAPRPYIPEGTGYKYLRSRPGVKNIMKTLDASDRLDYDQFKQFRRPASRGFNSWKNDPLDLFMDDMWKDMLMQHHKYTNTAASVHPGDADADMPRRTMVIPERGADPDAIKIRRHEMGHLMDPKLKDRSTTGSELRARIAEEKSIRKGFNNWNEAKADYWARDIDRGNYDKARQVLKEDKYKTQPVRKILNKIPSKPGMMTGRLPTPRGMLGFGAGMLNFGPLQNTPNYMGSEDDQI